MLPAKKPKPDHLLARVNELDKYGWIGTIDVLAHGDLTKWAQVMSVSFEKTITKLALDRDVFEYNERLNKILRDKQK